MGVFGKAAGPLTTLFPRYWTAQARVARQLFPSETIVVQKGEFKPCGPFFFLFFFSLPTSWRDRARLPLTESTSQAVILWRARESWC